MVPAVAEASSSGWAWKKTIVAMSTMVTHRLDVAAGHCARQPIVAIRAVRHTCGVDSNLVIALLALLLAALGLLGIVLPVLPGSITIALGLLVWGAWGGSSWGWIAAGFGCGFVLIGMTASWLLTRRRLKDRSIPRWPILIGLLGGLVGMLLLPGFGLVIGFVVGLFIAEWVRVRDPAEALGSSWIALKAIGVGMVIELLCAGVAVVLLTASIAGSL